MPLAEIKDSPKKGIQFLDKNHVFIILSVVLEEADKVLEDGIIKLTELEVSPLSIRIRSTAER